MRSVEEEEERIKMENSIYSVGAEGQQPVMGRRIKGCRNHKTREWDDYIEIKRSWDESREFPLLCVLASFTTSDPETFEGSRTGSRLHVKLSEEAAKQQQTNTRGNFLFLFWINNLCHVFWHVVSTPHFDTLLLTAAVLWQIPKK